MSDKTEDKLIAQIIHLAFRVDRETDFSVYLNYSGHVQQLHIKISPHRDHWLMVLWEQSFYISGEMNGHKLDSTGSRISKTHKDYLRILKSDLKSILETGEIPQGHRATYDGKEQAA